MEKNGIVLFERFTKERGEMLKTFYAGTFIDRDKLSEAGINYPIKLEYYKRINEDELINGIQPKFGVSVVKTEYTADGIRVETKDFEHITNDERQANRILKLFKENDVTPIAAEDVLTDLLKQVI